MKKIYSFIALMLMCFAGTANAQSNWSEGDQVTADGIVEGKYYLLTGGDNTLAEIIDEQTGAHKLGDHAKHLGKYLTSSQKQPTADLEEGCVFQFVKTDKMMNDVYPVYALKNLANGKYLSGNFQYAETSAEAYQFTVRDAVLKDEPADDKPMSNAEPAWTWEEYSNAASSTRSIFAVEKGAVILCLVTSPTYLNFSNGANPDSHGWIDTNNWLIYEAVGSDMSEYDKFNAVNDKYFGDYDPDMTFPVGNNPGCVSQEFLDYVNVVYEAASDLALNGGEDAQYKEMSARIVKLFEEEVPQNLIPVGPGYFVLKNVDGRGFLTVTGDGNKARGSKDLATKNIVDGTDYNSWTPASTTAWNLSNVKYIWKLEPAEEDGKLLFKNFGTEKYITTKEGFPMGNEGSPFVSKNFSGAEFYLEFGNGGVLHMQNHGDHLMMNYPHPDDAGSRFLYYTIGQDVIDSMVVKVAQNTLNQELKDVLEQANEDYYGNQYTNYVPGNLYKDSVDAGLVKSIFKANANASGKTGAEIFDSKLGTFYHTEYEANDVKEGEHHWIKLDLGKKVSKLVVKFTKRQNQANGHISKYALYAPANGDTTQVFDQLVAMSEDSISYQYSGSTHIAEYELKTPVQYVKFEVLKTRGRDASEFDKMSKSGSGPFWHMAEFRLYDPADFEENPIFAMVPQDVKDALVASMEKGEAELAKKQATEATIKEIEDNLKKFWEAYPDPDGLKRDLENAAALVDLSTEMDEPTMGFYPTGSKDELMSVVNRITAEVDGLIESGKALSKEEIEAYTAELDAAIAAFSEKLVKPEVGKVYMIISKSAVADDNAPQKEACVVSLDADLKNGTPVFRYKFTDGVGERFNAYWLVEKCGDGFAFKNLANGLYMNNVFDGLTKEEIDSLDLPNNHIGYSETPKKFMLESFSKEGVEPGFFIMTLMKGQYLNCQQTGKVMVYYSERNDDNAPFTFVEVGSAQLPFEGFYALDVEPGKTQILSCPIDLKNLYTAYGNIPLEVVGRNGNNIILRGFENEVIPAGAPFVITTASADEDSKDGETAILAELTARNLDETKKLDYNYDVVNNNGLVSAPRTIQIAEGFGVIVNGTVIPSKAGATINAGRGFFSMNEMPTTEETSKYIIPVEGNFSAGDITAVENVEIVKNVPSDVYTVAGVKVRSNVKLSNATQGLPKGVYIVAGKKVIVK